MCRSTSARPAPRWWTRELASVCDPISLEPIRAMRYPPFCLRADPEALATRTTIPKTEQRGITLRQLQDLWGHIERRCVAEGWHNREGNLLTPDKVNLYEAVSHVVKPATKASRCSYVELVTNAAQTPTWFVTHWQREPESQPLPVRSPSRRRRSDVGKQKQRKLRKRKLRVATPSGEVGSARGGPLGGAREAREGAVPGRGRGDGRGDLLGALAAFCRNTEDSALALLIGMGLGCSR